MSHEARYWTKQSDGRIRCDLCPRYCVLNAGQRGFCFVRQREGDGMVLTTYGRSSGFCVDPIEKKPLNHFLPGTPVFSFGTAGCNLGCMYCQNWDISKSKEADRAADVASPEAIADAAVEAGCPSVAFTYNDPVIFIEYAVDVARACRDRGVKTVAVTAGYICDEPRRELFSVMDAANVDLKAPSTAGGELQGILTALEATSLDLRDTRLVVLSACETGLGQFASGEGVYGLAQSLHEAGARAVLATLWPVSDAATAVFMQRFYARLAAGDDPQVALQTVQRAFASEGEFRDPIFWAPFVLTGR